MRLLELSLKYVVIVLITLKTPNALGATQWPSAPLSEASLEDGLSKHPFYAHTIKFTQCLSFADRLSTKLFAALLIFFWT